MASILLNFNELVKRDLHRCPFECVPRIFVAQQSRQKWFGILVIEVSLIVIIKIKTVNVSSRCFILCCYFVGKVNPHKLTVRTCNNRCDQFIVVYTKGASKTELIIALGRLAITVVVSDLICIFVLKWPWLLWFTEDQPRQRESMATWNSSDSPQASSSSGTLCHVSLQ